MTAEFFGLDGPRPQLRDRAIHQIQGPRKAYHQIGVDELAQQDRALVLADHSRRAIEFFNTLNGVDWKTLEFRIVNHGTEPPGCQLWRWEVWTLA